jgi:two-component system CheB/CheR fusion protein
MNHSSIQTKVPDNVKAFTDQLLVEQFSPASVLVTPQGDILYLTGNIGKYLTPTAGKVNMNLFAMVNEGLRNNLPVAFRKALNSNEKIVIGYDHKGQNGEIHPTELTIQQIEKPSMLKNKVLLVFNDIADEKLKPPKPKKREHIDILMHDEIKFELQNLKEELESTREEMQTSQEELKSANEELQSTNEELQSTNEELTTSKEEMQSLNEELQTVNIEMQSRIDDFVRVNNDMNNLLNSIEIATLFLDKELKIRQFTTPTTKIFKLKQSDIGRLFTDQVTDLDYHEMYNDAKEVLQTLVFREKAISTGDGRWFNIRIMPYRTFEDKIDGLVITFINITESKLMEEALKDSQIMFQSMAAAIPTGIISLSENGKIKDFNLEAEKITGYIFEEVKDNSYFDLFIDEASRSKEEKNMKKFCDGEIPNTYDNSIKLSNGRKLPVKWSAFRTMNKQHMLYGIIQTKTNAKNS